MKPLIKYQLPEPNSQGDFAVARKYDVHTGIDLYCDKGDQVYAIEKGTIVNICNFTGEKAGSPWWNDTMAVLVEGKSGVILYGEIDVDNDLFVGKLLFEGDGIGTIKTVLKKDKGLPMNMLHLELYERGYKGDGEIWQLGEIKPEMLLDPRILL